MSNENAIVERQESAAVVYDYGAYEGRGYQNQTGQDLALPFIAVLQANSKPVVKSEEDGGIEGARAGMLINTVTRELIKGKEGLTFVPAVTEHVYVEWKPVDQGGGFQGVHKITSEVVRDAIAEGTRLKVKFGKWSTSYDADGKQTGNDLVETFYVYGALVDDEGNFQLAVLSFKSKHIKAYKQWSGSLRACTVAVNMPDGSVRKMNPPLFAHECRLVTFADKHNGHDFYNVALKPAKGNLRDSLLQPTDPRFQAGEQLEEAVLGGLLRASYETENAAEEVPQAGATATGAKGETEAF